MKKTLEEYGYDSDVIKKVKGIANKISDNKQFEAEKEIAKLAIDICDLIEKKGIQLKKADDYFTVINIYVGDNLPKFKFNKDISDLIFEGMLLHDYGTKHGADLSLMRRLANKKLEEDKA